MRFYERVNELCAQRGISITALAVELGFSKGTPSNWKTMTNPPRAENIKKVADFFGVPTTYFNGDSSASVKSVQDNHGIIGSTHAPVTIINESERALSAQELELLHIFGGLDVVKQAKLLVYASELGSAR